MPGWIGLGKVERRQGRHEAALEAFRRGQVLNRHHPGILLEIARTLRELGRFSEALECLEGCEDVHPNPGLVWHVRGSIASYQNDIEQALRCYATGIQRQPDAIACYRSRIEECLNAGLFACAEDTLHVAFTKMPDSRILRLIKARLHKARGQISESLLVARALLLEFPDDPEAQLCCAAVCFAAGYFSEATQMLDAVRTETQGQQFHRAVLRGHVAMAQLRAMEAEGHYREASCIFPRAVSAHLQCAQMKLLQGDFEGCQASLALAESFNAQQASVRQMEFNMAGINAIKDMLAANTCDQELRSQFIGVLAKPLRDQPEELVRMLAYEDSLFSVPLALLGSLSHLGAFCYPKSKFNCQPVPKHIIQYWDSPDIPDAIQETMRSWSEQCRGYRYTLFDKQRAGDFIAENCGEEVSQAFASSAQPTLRSDLFRLAYLYACGGVYVDADDRCLEDISPWLDEDPCDLVLYIEILGSIGNNFLAAAPRHPFIHAALKRISENILERRGHSVWYVSGPGAMTAAFCRHYAHILGQSLCPPGVRLCDQVASRRKVCMHIRHTYKRDGGHWNASKSRQAALFAQ